MKEFTYREVGVAEVIVGRVIEILINNVFPLLYCIGYHSAVKQLIAVIKAGSNRVSDPFEPAVVTRAEEGLTPVLNCQIRSDVEVGPY